MMDISNKPDQPDNKLSHFINIWGTKETRCSALMAQTIVLSRKFREFIADILRIEHEQFILNTIQTEYSFLAPNRNRVDILIQCWNGLFIGIENKKWAGLQGNDQLFRYEKSLKEKSKDCYKLVFLAPSTYKLEESWKPKNLIELPYKTIYNWIDKPQSFDSDFEKHYFDELRLYFDDLELEMRPFTARQIDSLKETNADAIKKLNWLLKTMKFADSEKNQGHGGYTSDKIYIKSLPVLVGFRYSSDTGWFREELLQSQPECLIYIYDEWNDIEQQDRNRHVKDIYDSLNGKIDCIGFHPRNKNGECRLSIRKSLMDFEGKEVETILQWFRINFSLLKKAIEENVRE